MTEFQSCLPLKPGIWAVSEPWPSELRLSDAGHNMKISFQSGETFDLPAELLRVESPSAEVRGHGPGQEQLVFGKRLVSILRIGPVGNYAVRLMFSDGHSSGIFTWAYLAKLGVEQDEIWNAYLAKLEAEGRSRDP